MFISRKFFVLFANKEKCLKHEMHHFIITLTDSSHSEIFLEIFGTFDTFYYNDCVRMYKILFQDDVKL